jgi:hypothetical protein
MCRSSLTLPVSAPFFLLDARRIDGDGGPSAAIPLELDDRDDAEYSVTKRIPSLFTHLANDL